MSAGSGGRVRRPGPTGRQAELLDALVALFLAEGFSAFTIDDLSRRLRCSKTTLYTLAPSKEQLAVAVVVHYFRGAALRVEAGLDAAGDPREGVVRYLAAVADELRPASRTFLDDVTAFPPAREVYERNTRIAADRLREIVTDGSGRGVFRSVHAAFVAEVAAATMVAIQHGDLAAQTGLSDAQAYDELASLLVHALSPAAT